MRNYLKPILVIVLILAVVSTVLYMRKPYHTVIVSSVDWTDTIGGAGILLRDETVVTNNTSGVFESLVTEGERVHKEERLGTVISGSVNDDMLTELAELTERIDTLRQSSSLATIYASDDIRLDAAIQSSVLALSRASARDDMDSATALKTEIALLVDRKRGIDTAGAQSELLSELEARKATLESTLGGVQREIYAPISGIYSTRLDGLEAEVSVNRIADLTTEDVVQMAEAAQAGYSSNTSICKIIDNYTWYLAAVVEAERVQSLEKGDSVRLRIGESTTMLPAKVARVCDTVEEQTAIVLECTRFVDGLTSLRRVDFEVQLNSYSGIQIPAEARRVVNGETGVYVLSDKKAVFRPIRILYQSDEACIIGDWTADERQSVKQYDEVLLDPEHVPGFSK